MRLVASIMPATASAGSAHAVGSAPSIQAATIPRVMRVLITRSAVPMLAFIKKLALGGRVAFEIGWDVPLAVLMLNQN